MHTNRSCDTNSSADQQLLLLCRNFVCEMHCYCYEECLTWWCVLPDAHLSVGVLRPACDGRVAGGEYENGRYALVHWPLRARHVLGSAHSHLSYIVCYTGGVCYVTLCVCYTIADNVSCSVNSYHWVLRLEMTYYALSAANIFSHSSRVCRQSNVNQNAFKTLFICHVWCSNVGNIAPNFDWQLVIA